MAVVRAVCSEKLGYLFRISGRFADAVKHYRKSIEIFEQCLGKASNSSPELAQSINGLAIVHRKMGNYLEAEPLYLRALRIRKQVLGAMHPDVGQSMNSLGCLFQDQGKYAESEQYFRQAIQVREYAYGPNHPDVAMSVANLASLFGAQGKYDQAGMNPCALARSLSLLCAHVN